MTQNPTPSSGASAAPASTRWVLPVTILGSSLGFIDGSVVNVALPAMQSTLASSLATMQWVINGYMLMLASLILLGGALGDRFGTRRIFITGLAIFAAASIACGLAPGADTLVLARLVQGAGAALFVPTSLAIIGAAYSEAARGRAIGTWAAAAGIMTAIGPPLGGWLVDGFGWRSVFIINPPIALIAILLALKLPKDHAPTSERLDIAGSILAVLTLGLMSYGLIALGAGQRTSGGVALAASLPIGLAFILVERHSASAMVPLGLFANSNFAGANLMTVILYAALSGSLFMLPFMLMKVHHYSATQAGAAFLPFSLIIGLGSRAAGSLAGRVGARLPLVIGPLLAGFGLALMGVVGDKPNYWTDFFPGLLLLGIGMTIAIPPLTTIVFDSVPKEKNGTASGINNAAARSGGLLAVAAVGLAFGGADLDVLGAQALEQAYFVAMLSGAALAALSALCAALTIHPKVKKPA